MILKARIARLETAVESRKTEIRVAGKSRSEFHAEMLLRLFCRFEATRAGAAAAFLQTAKAELHPDSPKEIEQLVKVVQSVDRMNPGLPARVLEAVLSGADAITEETLFPAGRPDEEQTYYSRQGTRFVCRVTR